MEYEKVMMIMTMIVLLQVGPRRAKLQEVLIIRTNLDDARPRKTTAVHQTWQVNFLSRYFDFR